MLIDGMLQENVIVVVIVIFPLPISYIYDIGQPLFGIMVASHNFTINVASRLHSSQNAVI